VIEVELAIEGVVPKKLKLRKISNPTMTVVGTKRPHFACINGGRWGGRHY